MASSSVYALVVPQFVGGGRILLLVAKLFICKSLKLRLLQSKLLLAEE